MKILSGKTDHPLRSRHVFPSHVTDCGLEHDAADHKSSLGKNDRPVGRTGTATMKDPFYENPLWKTDHPLGSRLVFPAARPIVA